MKKTFKKVASLTLATVITVTSCFSFQANAANPAKSFQQEKKLLTVLNSSDKRTKNTIKNMIKEMIPADSYSSLEVHDYVSAYNVDSKETFYLYPVSIDGIVLYTAHTDKNGDVTITNNTKALSSINKLSDGDSYAIYVDNGIYYAADDDETVELYKEGYDIYDEGLNFDNLSYEDIYDTITKGVDYLFEEFEELTLKDTLSSSTDETILTGWEDWWNWWDDTPTGENVTQKCGITNFLRQGNYGLCWACTVGTIVNYKTGLNLTGMDIADRMGIGYDDGGTIYQIQQALGLYGLSYTVKTSKPSFAQVKSNIDADRPFGICLTASNAGHAITGYGYAYNTGDTSANASTNLVYAWDSNGYQISFKHNANTISTSGYNFTWYGAVM